MKGTYFRWTRNDTGTLSADILGPEIDVTANPIAGTVFLTAPDRSLSPDEARMVGVRLIEAASIADADRAIRE